MSCSYLPELVPAWFSSLALAVQTYGKSKEPKYLEKMLQGIVKLADFGVAAKLTDVEDGGDNMRISVVGTPYWMAPEMIEMTSVTAASDIWSVGCLAIELLTGSPPYFEHAPMSALFRIVQVCRQGLLHIPRSRPGLENQSNLSPLDNLSLPCV